MQRRPGASPRRTVSYMFYFSQIPTEFIAMLRSAFCKTLRNTQRNSARTVFLKMSDYLFKLVLFDSFLPSHEAPQRPLVVRIEPEWFFEVEEFEAKNIGNIRIHLNTLPIPKLFERLLKYM